ncbi:MAG: signal peptidase I [Gemmiger sp.]|nr:signal peptidase I [Gemmiger sp.]
MTRKAGALIAAVLTALLLALAVLLVGVRLIGLTPYTVQTGSMVPQYPVGSLIYVRHVAPEQISVGDAITFVMDAQGQVATHQVWQVDTQTRCFYTQGIANIGPDGSPVHDGQPVPFGNLVGRPVLCIPLLGYLAAWLTTAPGRCATAALLLCALVFDLLPGAAQKRSPNRPGVVPALGPASKPKT